MKNLQEIQDEYAVEMAYKNWENLLYNVITKHPPLLASLVIDEHLKEVFELVQQEQQKLIAENADTKMERYNDLQDVVVVDKSSILNENNIIR